MICNNFNYNLKTNKNRIIYSFMIRVKSLFKILNNRYNNTSIVINKIALIIHNKHNKVVLIKKTYMMRFQRNNFKKSTLYINKYYNNNKQYKSKNN